MQATSGRPAQRVPIGRIKSQFTPGDSVSTRTVDDLYSHITDQMVEETLDALQQRWEQDGGWTWQDNPAVEPEAA